MVMPHDSLPVDNKVFVLVLQHPQEKDRVLGSAGLLVRSLGRAQLTIGLSWRNLAHALRQPAEPRNWGVLYLGSTQTQDLAPSGEPLIALDRKGQPLADQGAAHDGLDGLVVLDGNWAQAKALWWRNPWLTKLRRFVVLPDRPSLYGELRREARRDALSTLESVALALSVLEHDPSMRDRLLVPFKALLSGARAAGVRDSKRDRRSRRQPL
jgi:DTW domain-containing protein YfiP